MRPLLALCAATLLSVAPGAATAASDARLDLQRFFPAPGGTGFFTVQGGEVVRHLAGGGGLHLIYAGHPLEIEQLNADGSVQPIGTAVRHRVDAVATGALGLFGVVELGAALPAVWEQGLDAGTFARQAVDVGATALRAVSLGDLRLVPKVRLLDVQDGRLALAVLADVRLPTAGGAPFVGEAGVGVTPTVALSSRVGPARFGLDLGYRYRRPVTLVTQAIGPELTFAAAASLVLLPSEPLPLMVIAEAYGATPVRHPFGAGVAAADAALARVATPVEVVGGLRASHGDLVVTVGAGAGASTGYGAARPRVFVAVAWDHGHSGPPDRDHDGIPDDVDRCPDAPEDKDGFEDADGCPDPDNDQDGVPDEDDQCPMAPEDRDGFEDEDGCPDPDNDKDGIPDAQDRCPNDPEDKDGFEDEDGCPDLDNDKDGIPDALDRCPNEPEDLDGFEDSDGCPDLDNDGDGLPDRADQCPNYPEDKDGFRDDDGCPDDNDGDGIPDDKDRCPNQAENYNGFEDEDGCPDAPHRPSFVAVTDEQILIKQPIAFGRDAAVILPKSQAVLVQVANVLRNFRHVTKVRIEVHTEGGSRVHAMALSHARAQAVRAQLIARGIAATRLEAVGLPPTPPRAKGRAPAHPDRGQVTFVIAAQHPIGNPVRPKVADPHFDLALPDAGVPPAAPAAPDASGAPSPADTPVPAAPAAPAPAPAPLFEIAPPSAPPAPAPASPEGRRGATKGRPGAARPTPPAPPAPAPAAPPGDIQFGL